MDTVHRHWESALKVNADGNPASLPDGHPLATAQWMRLSMVRAKVTLPNGYCGAPVQTDCEYASPCLDCAAIAELMKRRAAPGRTAPPAAASDGSLRQRLEASQASGKKLREDHTDLRRRLEAAHRGDPPAPRPRTAPGRLTRPEKPAAHRQMAYRRPRAPPAAL